MLVFLLTEKLVAGVSADGKGSFSADRSSGVRMFYGTDMLYHSYHSDKFLDSTYLV